MSGQGIDVLSATDTEILLKQLNHSFYKFILKGVGILAAVSLFGLLSSGKLVSLCTIPVLVPLALAAWHLPDRTTRMIFNQPQGYLTIEESPWWSIFIPGGPYYFKDMEQVRLPNRSLILEELSGAQDHNVQVGPSRRELRRSFFESYYVNIPLEDGSEYLLWATNDRQTFELITKRLNHAIENCRQVR
jgi:hypothetical protein